MRCDAKSWRCAFSLRKSSAMRPHDAKTLAMRCRDAGHAAALSSRRAWSRHFLKIGCALLSCCVEVPAFVFNEALGAATSKFHLGQEVRGRIVRLRDKDTAWPLRKRDDNKNKICAFRGGGVGRGAGRIIVQNAIFHGKRHDDKTLKVKILLSRNFVVMAQTPNHGL